ncbi:hypothetical protein [Amycolatopsis sp. DG1A-15b]|uniref:methyltransferase family protein n=1 Tax=Amycolatopsis sp. DG1A-15b TaxID=3052846 RepID=UPI00255B656A|nr:hypothetical protein [Amycolatopsis sp. DG1A-15b]WIX92953.1 hypothetical protein QRY02_21955 [Amycolatopsis sp. DG1A-15b]
MTIPADFQHRLIDAISPIRHFFLAQALHHALDLGIFEALDEHSGVDATALAAKLGLDADRLPGLLLFLQNEGFVVDEDGWRSTALGAGLPVFAPWYEMLVGGYASTMQQLGEVLRPGASWATRDTTRVGAGSCGIGRYDAVPVVQALLSASPDTSSVIDLGCGDGRFLMDVLLSRPGLRGVGIEPNPASVRLGESARAELGLDDRLEMVIGAADAAAGIDLPGNGHGTCFMTAFVLQEMLEQEGEEAVEELLRSTFRNHPEARWLVVEMDYQPEAPVMAHGLALSFYNPYFLIHSITEQRLQSRQWWAELFQRVGLTCLSEAETDPRVDTTGLQFGMLLARR